jgi:hypothetical protein
LLLKTSRTIGNERKKIRRVLLLVEVTFSNIKEVYVELDLTVVQEYGHSTLTRVIAQPTEGFACFMVS